MQDFWELTGRLMMMKQSDRDEFYKVNVPIPAGEDCILPRNRDTMILPYPQEMYDGENGVRTYFIRRYGNLLGNVPISLFAAGEVMTMFFFDRWRKYFDAVADMAQTLLPGIDDRSASPDFYVMMGLTLVDKRARADFPANISDLFVATPKEVEQVQYFVNHERAAAPLMAFSADDNWEPGCFTTYFFSTTYQKSTVVHRHVRFLSGQ